MSLNGANEDTFSPSFYVYLVFVRIVGVKCKFVSVPYYEPRLEGIYVIKVYTWLLNSALSGDEWLASQSGRFTHRQSIAKYPQNWRLSGPRNGPVFCTEEKSVSPSRNRTTISQSSKPWASHHQLSYPTSKTVHKIFWKIKIGTRCPFPCDSSVGIATLYGLGGPGIESGGGVDHQHLDGCPGAPPVKWVTRLFTGGWSDQCVALITQLSLAPRLKKE